MKIKGCNNLKELKELCLNNILVNMAERMHFPCKRDANIIWTVHRMTFRVKTPFGKNNNCILF